jgi:hypothetical protein
VEIWVRKCSSFEEEAAADREFWARMSPGERVAAVDQMRRWWLLTQGLPDEGLRRTARVVPQSGLIFTKLANLRLESNSSP